ncbi:hypothetical protein [Streptomyces zaomyceticus]|uniref:hypothetical protein n=1 Tax=Streptomyces zaomyceticus TaxID=68286 RepID=UPI00343E348A
MSIVVAEICPVAAANAPLLARDGVAVRPVDGVAPSRFALAWRADDTRPRVHAHARAAAGAAPQDR